MRKLLIICFIVISIVLCIALCACTDDKQSSDCLSYEMELSLTDNVIDGKQTISYKNIYADSLGESVFHLYPNVFTADAENPAYTGELECYGGIEIINVSLGEDSVEYTLSDNKEYLIVKHDGIKKNQDICIDIEYKTTLPTGKMRLSANGNMYVLSGFYPQLSVYENGAFRMDKYCTVGDPYFSSVAKYNVAFECDKSLVVCSSMKCGNITTTDKRQTITFTGENIRDFALAGSPDYNVINTKAGEVNVYYFYINDENAQETIDTASKAITTFSDNFGAYPFDTYTVVRVPFDFDGMEYSGISFVAENCMSVNDIVIHETAHQWWYGMVGSDCINESYMDEGLTTFCEVYYYALCGEKEKFEEKINAIKRTYISYEQLQKKRKSDVNLSMNKPIYEFTEYQYTMVEYYKACMMFESIYTLYGSEKFNACLKKYCEDNKFKMGGKEEFCRSAKGTLGDIGGLIEGWLGDKVVATTFATK